MCFYCHQVEGPETHEEMEYQKLRRRLIEEYGRAPQVMADAIRTAHQNQSGNLSRYVVAEAIRNVLLYRTRTTMSTFRTACTTGLPEALLSVAYDPSLYMWHDEDSELYHPRLGVSRLILCLIGLSTSNNEM